MPSPYKENYGVNSVTTATLTLTADAYVGRPIALNRAAGITFTLPKATGSGNTYEFVVTTTLTGNGIIRVVDSTDIIQGFSFINGASLAFFGTAGTSDTITLNGTTTGGLIGSYVVVRDTAATVWTCEVYGIGSGTAATPFSATV